jgi:hypothetical protein
VFAHQPDEGFLYGGVLQIDDFEGYSLGRGKGENITIGGL